MNSAGIDPLNGDRWPASSQEERQEKDNAEVHFPSHHRRSRSQGKEPFKKSLDTRQCNRSRLHQQTYVIFHYHVCVKTKRARPLQRQKKSCALRSLPPRIVFATIRAAHYLWRNVARKKRASSKIRRQKVFPRRGREDQTLDAARARYLTHRRRACLDPRQQVFNLASHGEVSIRRRRLTPET